MVEKQLERESLRALFMMDTERGWAAGGHVGDGQQLLLRYEPAVDISDE